MPAKCEGKPAELERAKEYGVRSADVDPEDEAGDL